MYKLKPYQKECVSHIHEKKYCLITMNVGTGKTLTSLDALKNEDSFVILVQNKVMAKKWAKECKQFFDYDFESSEKESVYSFENKHIITFNAATKSIPDVKNIVIDEVHKMASPSTKRYKSIKKHLNGSNFDHIILLSATPSRNDVVDIYNEISLFGTHFELKREFRTIREFHNHFYDFSRQYNFFLKKVTPMPEKFRENLFPELNRLVNVFHFDHENFTYEEITLTFTKKNMEEYRFMQKYNCYKNEDILDTYSAATKLSQLMQLMNSTTTKSLYPVDYDFLTKIDMINTLLKIHGKVMVVYNFEMERVFLKDNLHSVTDNYDEYEDYDVYIRQCSRSEGIDVIDRDTMIFFSIGYSGVNYAQMKGRITRANSPFNKFYFYRLVFTNTIEPKIYDVVDGKLKDNELLKLID